MRALEIDPDNWYPMSYLSFLKHAQAYVAGTREEHLRASREADEWNRKIHRIMEAKARAAGQPWPPGQTATMTFRSVRQTASPTGKVTFPPFPPILNGLSRSGGRHRSGSQAARRASQ